MVSGEIPMLHNLALGQFKCSFPILYILFGDLQINVHNTNFIPSVIYA